MTTITVHKHNHNGKEVFAYQGELLERGATWLCLTAPFQIESADIDGLTTFRRGDIFTEWFYANRWYNIFQVEDRQTGALKGFYCNITRPAIITDGDVRADDLALDVFVQPDGTISLLDEDDFAALDLPPDERAAALDAVEQLRQDVASRAMPFDKLENL